jgi:PIN domain nuclease of toxin-antitoxin system
LHLLLDTHAFLWWQSRDRRLGVEARRALDDPDNRVLISAATVWEIAIKRQAGKLAFSGSVTKAVSEGGFEHLAITADHAEAAAALPLHHADPFDRMLIVQAKLEGLVLVTSDQQMGLYGVPILSA